MESTLFTELTTNEEASLCGGFFDFQTPVALNISVLNDGTQTQNASAIANTGRNSTFRNRQRG